MFKTFVRSLPIRWIFYLTSVVGAVGLGAFGCLYTPPQEAVFSGEIESGGESGEGTSLVFDQTPSDPGISTAVNSVAGISSTSLLVIELNSEMTSCETVNDALGELAQNFSCVADGGSVDLTLADASLGFTFEDLTRVAVGILGDSQVTIVESGRLRDFPFSRDVKVAPLPKDQRDGNDVPTLDTSVVTVRVHNQPGKTIAMNIGAKTVDFMPTKSALDEELIRFRLEGTSPPEGGHSSMKFLYESAAISFTGQYSAKSFCIDGISGRLDVGQRQEAVLPTDAWRIVGDSPGQVIITNARVTSRFPKAKGVILHAAASCATSDSVGEDKRRSWLSMRPVFQGAVGFIFSALILQPLVQQLVPVARKEE